MRKLSFLFVVLALAMFAAVFAASAQEATLSAEAELPAIDETEAAPYLGVWYMSKICFGTDCMDLAGMGMKQTLTFNTDNTAVMESEDGPQTIPWYMENGTAITLETVENETVKTPFPIDENGTITIESDGVSVVFTREIAPALGTGAIKENATLEDFSGDWFLTGMLAEGNVLPTSLIGMTGKLTVGETAMTIVLMDEASGEIPFELKDGKLYATALDKDIQGKETEIKFVFEYHVDNCIHMYEDGAQADSTMIFVREADVTKGPNVIDGIAQINGTEGEAVPEMSEAELKALLAEISTELETEGAAGEGFDLSSLLENIDLQAIMQNEKVQEILSNPELLGLISNLQNENGEFNLDSVVSGLGGLLGGSDESGLNLEGLMQGLGEFLGN